MNSHRPTHVNRSTSTSSKPTSTNTSPKHTGVGADRPSANYHPEKIRALQERLGRFKIKPQYSASDLRSQELVRQLDSDTAGASWEKSHRAMHARDVYEEEED